MIAMNHAEDSAGPLFEKWRSHLFLEEDLLRSTLDSLRHMRSALLRADATLLANCLQRHAGILEERDKAAQQREQLRGEIASITGRMPESIALHDVVDQLPAGARGPLTEQQDRLRLLAREADQLNRGNATLVCYNLEFLRRLLLGLTGGADDGPRYGPAGNIQLSGYGAIVSAQG